MKPLKAEHETKDITFDPKKVQNEIMCSQQDMAEIPQVLREAPNTPLTREVKRMVLNANRGLKDPLTHRDTVISSQEGPMKKHKRTNLPSYRMKQPPRKKAGKAAPAEDDEILF